MDALTEADGLADGLTDAEGLALMDADRLAEGDALGLPAASSHAAIIMATSSDLPIVQLWVVLPVPDFNSYWALVL